MNPQFRELVNKITDKPLREKTIAMIENPVFQAGGKTHSGIPLEVAPAGKSHHHCYPGGYVEHVVSTSTIALAMCKSVEEIYHGKVNRDLVIAGILLHDIFKPATYSVSKEGYYYSTSLADSLDHLSIAVSELVRRDFPLELVHIVAAHHGEYGPVRPRTVEALICHLADFTDSRLNGEVLSAAKYLARRVAAQEPSTMTSNEAFEIVHSKAAEGWEGVTKALQRINRTRKAHKT